MKRVFLAGILGAIVLFIWSSVSWMVLPWHNKTLHTFKDEASVAAVLQANVKGSGMYLMPDFSANPMNTHLPMVFAAISLKGMTSMGSAMLVFFMIQLVAALLVSYMLSKTSCHGYFGRLTFILVFAIAAAILANLPYWSWWGFEINYTLVTMADMIVAWSLAGLVIAALIKPDDVAIQPE